MASSRRGTLYIGVTSDLCTRIYNHKNEITGGFTTKYNIKVLVYYELHENIESAILMEKRIKRWPRQYKYNLIEENNPEWQDLYFSLCGSEPDPGTSPG